MSARTPTQAERIDAALLAWFLEHGRDLPWRHPDFPVWGTLVSEFMLQQTPVARVLPRLERWLERWPTPADLAATEPAEAVRAWDNLGYPRRALWLHAAAVQITERHGGIVPRDVDTLLALTGVGDYTARAVAVFGYGDHHPVVDTNVRRVIARAVTGQGEPGPPATARDLAEMTALMPSDPELSPAFNAAIMELGALVCTARSPKCEVCPLAELCAWRQAGSPPYLGKTKRVQASFAGSDRQVRGLILKELRGSTIPVSAEEIAAVWPDAVQRERALAGLIADGLAAAHQGGFTLA